MAKRIRRPAYATGEISFHDDHRAKWVQVPSGADPRAALAAFDLPHFRSILLLVGGADGVDPALKSRLRECFSQAIAPAAMESEALVIDGGTATGVMELMGESAAQAGNRVPVLGVAPAPLVTWPGGPDRAPDHARASLDAGHSHFLLVDAPEWGGETPSLIELTAAGGEEVPVVALLINGGEIAREEVLAAVQHRWQIVVLSGSGRLADAVTEARDHPPAGDPALAKIVEAGTPCVVPVDATADLQQVLTESLGRNALLQQTWERFARYDANANFRQRTFQRLLFSSLILGVLATLGSILTTWLPESTALRIVVVALTAGVTALLAAASRFRSGAQWVALRARAEALKAAIFRYRADLGIREMAPGAAREPCERRLVARLKALSRAFAKGEAGPLALRSYKGRVPPPEVLASADGGLGKDDGLSPLTPHRYLKFRLEDQLRYYHGKMHRMDRRANQILWIVIVAGGVGTVIAAAGWPAWVALVTAVIGGLSAWLGFLQADRRLFQFHQAASKLEDLRASWSALTFQEQGNPRRFKTLVESTESVIAAEIAGWTQETQKNLDQMLAQSEQLQRGRRGGKPVSGGPGGSAG